MSGEDLRDAPFCAAEMMKKIICLSCIIWPGPANKIADAASNWVLTKWDLHCREMH